MESIENDNELLYIRTYYVHNPNNALESGDIDAKLFQKTTNLENVIKETKAALSPLIIVPTAPMVIYLDKFKTIEDGAKITIPNDPINGARALNS